VAVFLLTLCCLGELVPHWGGVLFRSERAHKSLDLNTHALFQQHAIDIVVKLRMTHDGQENLVVDLRNMGHTHTPSTGCPQFQIHPSPFSASRVLSIKELSFPALSWDELI